MADHRFSARIIWTGNKGEGTASYRGYARDHKIEIEGKPVIAGSSDPAYLGDAGRHNPEDMLIASLSSCHMLWYLHLCSEYGVIVEAYEDEATGTMAVHKNGAGEFTEVMLHPAVTISKGDMETANALHEKAHAMCFIARSVNFPVRRQAKISFRA